MSKKFKRLAVLALLGTAVTAGIAAAQPRGGGECGEYMFWHDGQCSDARDKKGSKTWIEELLAKQWKP